MIGSTLFINDTGCATVFRLSDGTRWLARRLRKVAPPTAADLEVSRDLILTLEAHLILQHDQFVPAPNRATSGTMLLNFNFYNFTYLTVQEICVASPKLIQTVPVTESGI